MKVNLVVASTKINTKAEPFMVRRRQHGMAHTDRRAGHFDGVVGTARWQGHAEQLEKPSSSPSRNRGSKVARITGQTGKASEDETVAATPVVAKKWGNACGAKGPCCTGSLHQEGRQG